MSFRDDREALSERVATLERELADARREAGANREAADQVTSLLSRVRALSTERDRRAQTDDPSRRRRRALATIGVLAVIVAGWQIAGTLADQARGDAEASAAGEALRLTTALSAAQSETARVRDDARVAADRASQAESALAAARHDDAVRSLPTRSSVRLRGRVATAPAIASDLVGSACDVSVQRDDTGCLAEVVCAGRVLYRSGVVLAFACSEGDGHGLRGVAPDLISPGAAPRLDLDVDRGTARVLIPGGLLVIALEHHR